MVLLKWRKSNKDNIFTIFPNIYVFQIYIYLKSILILADPHTVQVLKKKKIKQSTVNLKTSWGYTWLTLPKMESTSLKSNSEVNGTDHRQVGVQIFEESVF